MKTLSRILSIFSAVFGLLTLLPSPKSRKGRYVWLPKLWAGAWSPFAAVFGLLGALLGLGRKDRASILLGMFGALAGARYTQRVTKKQDAFDLGLGKDWEQKISPAQWNRLARPYQFIQPEKPLGMYQRDINFGSDDAPLMCDIWLPPNGAEYSRLGVIHLRGSFWRAEDKNSLARPLFARLVNQGHVVMDISFASSASMPQMTDDVKRAILWMKDHARELNIDPNRIVLMGGSIAGGQIALFSAYTPERKTKRAKFDTSVCGVISVCGATDLKAYFHEHSAMNSQPEISSQADLSGALSEVPEVYELYSPLARAGQHCPPTLQIFAEDDFAISTAHGKRLHTALQTIGVPSVYVEYPETVHAFDQYIGVSRRVAPAAQMASNDIEQFLAWLV